MRMIGFMGLALLSLASCGGAPEAGQLFIDSKAGGLFEGSAGAGISERDIRQYVQIDVCRGSGTITEFTSAQAEGGVTTFSGRCG